MTGDGIDRDGIPDALVDALICLISVAQVDLDPDAAIVTWLADHPDLVQPVVAALCPGETRTEWGVSYFGNEPCVEPEDAARMHAARSSHYSLARRRAAGPWRPVVGSLADTEKENDG